MTKAFLLVLLFLTFVTSSHSAEYCASAESRGLTATVPLTIGADYNVQTPLGAWWYLGVGWQMDNFEQCMDESQQGTYWSDTSGMTTVAIIGVGTCDPPQVLGSFTLYQMVEPYVPCPDVPDPPPDTTFTNADVISVMYSAALAILFALGLIAGMK